MVKRIPMDGGDESHIDPREAARRRDAVGAQIMDHWRSFGVAFKAQNAQGMANITEGMKHLSKMYDIHDAYTRPGYSGRPRGGGGGGGSGPGGRGGAPGEGPRGGGAGGEGGILKKKVR